MGFDPLLAVTVILLLMTLGLAVLYYKRIRRAQGAYEEARDVVGDIIISFDKQLERQEGGLHTVARRTEALSYRSEELAKKVEKHGRKLATLATDVENAPKIRSEVSAQFERIDEKMGDLVRAQETMTQKIEELERAEREVPAAMTVAEAEAETVIPIKRERALAPLTETELRVLKILADGGGSTAPEIRRRIQLSREHTARLMRKLYGNGYLERNTEKMPYTYRIKREMAKILKGPEVKAESGS